MSRKDELRAAVSESFGDMVEAPTLQKQNRTCFTVANDNVDGELAALFQRATSALQNQDHQLHSALVESDYAKEYAARSALGLAYWVFEHNIVYTIFCEWSGTHRVLWDETPSARWKTSEPDRAKTERRAVTMAQYIDLQVLPNIPNAKRKRGRPSRWLFEAKWFNKDYKGVVKKDAEKLRDLHSANHSLSPFHLLVCSGQMSKMNTIPQRLSKAGLAPPVFAGVFSTQTQLVDGDLDYLALMAVPA